MHSASTGHPASTRALAVGAAPGPGAARSGTSVAGKSTGGVANTAQLKDATGGVTAMLQQLVSKQAQRNAEVVQ